MEAGCAFRKFRFKRRQFVPNPVVSRTTDVCVCVCVRSICVHRNIAMCIALANIICHNRLYGCARTTVTDTSPTTTVHEGPPPRPQSTVTTAKAASGAGDRPRTDGAEGRAPRGGSDGGRRSRRRNARPSSTRRPAADADAPEFPVTFTSSDLFVVTKAKLYATFSISFKVFAE